MLTLIVGFVGIVLMPALILSLIMGRIQRARIQKSPVDLYLHEDSLKFKMSPHVK